MIDHQRLLDRFLRYVQVDTTAVLDAPTYPSSPGQWELGRMLVAELLAIGLADATQDACGIVLATLPGNTTRPAPVIAFNAHVDTSPETTGKNVRPQVHRNYSGGDLVLPGDSSRVIRVAENPELAGLVGQTIVTSDGTTLLGADDKSGLAVIVEAMAFLREHPEVPHGPVRVCFTCDEEIGHGVDHVDLAQLGATVCYTLDGGGRDAIDVETFSADHALVTFMGRNIHPSIGKGRMINALRMAAAFVDRLPRQSQSPETTDGREGFLHPYGLEGGVAQATLRVLLRDFETPRLAEQAALLRRLAREVTDEFPGSAVEVDVSTQYRNMAAGLLGEPRALALAERAHRRLGREPRQTIVRGGTDGSRFTELGLPTPNLSTGEHNPHSPLEWTCVEEMAAAAEVVVALCQEWATEGGHG